MYASINLLRRADSGVIRNGLLYTYIMNEQCFDAKLFDLKCKWKSFPGKLRRKFHRSKHAVKVRP